MSPNSVKLLFRVQFIPRLYAIGPALHRERVRDDDTDRDKKGVNIQNINLISVSYP